MEQGYWQRKRLSRRRVLVGGAGFGAGSLFLAACGGSNNNSKPAATTGVTAPSATAARVASPAAGGSPVAPRAGSPAAAVASASPPAVAIKKGGTWNSAITTDIPTIDPLASPSAQTRGISSYVYSRLFSFESAKPDARGGVSFKPVPDAAESFEATPDGLKYTVKLRPNVKWHAPISRAMTAEDVVFSWQRFAGKLADAKPLPNSDRLSMIDKVEAPDPRTVVFTLKQPTGPFISLLADGTLLYLMPKETGTAFDPAKTMVGSGGWLLDSYTPSSTIAFKRNPDWHNGPDRPYLDRLVINIIKDPATLLNQFLGGNLDTAGVNAIDLATVKQKIPGVQLQSRDTSALDGMIGFERVTEQRAGAPWNDVRVRRALSMAIDRDALVKVAYNTDMLKAAGIEPPNIWQGILPQIFGDLSLDPKSDPEINQYFKFDPKAAKALLDSAGGSFSANAHYESIAKEGVDIVELTQKYWSDIGLKIQIQLDDYASKFIPQTYKGNYDGLAFIGIAAIPEPGSFLAAGHARDGSLNFSKVDDPKIEDYLKRYNTELDDTKRKSVLLEFQKYLLTQLYYVPSQWGAFVGLSGFQPNVRGALDHVSFGYGSQGTDTTYLWKA